MAALLERIAASARLRALLAASVAATTCALSVLVDRLG